MSDTCPTVRIVSAEAPGGFVVINEDDLNPKLHTLYVEDDAPLADLTVAQLKALAEARGVDLGDATKKADMVAALELAAEASA